MKGRVSWLKKINSPGPGQDVYFCINAPSYKFKPYKLNNECAYYFKLDTITYKVI